jgi:hypothetical protein
MGDFTDSRLLYRASRDSFSGAVYHGLSNVPNTVTIIKSNLNYVFGVFTSIALNKTTGWYADPTAFIFSLRQNGTNNNVKLRSSGTHDISAQYALYINPTNGPRFGYYDLNVCDQSFSQGSSTSSLGYSYDSPVLIQQLAHNHI